MIGGVESGTMEGKRLLKTIRLDSILSFGPGTAELPLEPLNVLIGPNAVGKSNLIEALSLLAAAPRDLQAPIREGGGVRDWLWKGAAETPTATVDVTVESPMSQVAERYRLSFTETVDRFELRDEAIESERPLSPHERQPYIYYHYQEGRPVINVLTTEGQNMKRDLQREDVKLDQSILSQRRDPSSYPELWYLAIMFERMSLLPRVSRRAAYAAPPSTAGRSSTGYAPGGRLEPGRAAEQSVEPTAT